MTTLQIETEVTVPACAAAVYRVLADYAGSRRRLQSRRLVARSRVKAGGVGGGTRLEVTLHGSHGALPLDVSVTEPELGTVLVESDRAAGVRRTFVLEPCSRGCATRVHAVLEIEDRHVGGPLEHALRELHAKELERLPRAVEDRALADSLWPHPLDGERAAAFVPEPAFA
jgi:hypothetical protein